MAHGLVAVAEQQEAEYLLVISKILVQLLVLTVG